MYLDLCKYNSFCFCKMPMTAMVELLGEVLAWSTASESATMLYRIVRLVLCFSVETESEELTHHTMGTQQLGSEPRFLSLQAQPSTAELYVTAYTSNSSTELIYCASLSVGCH